MAMAEATGAPAADTPAVPAGALGAPAADAPAAGEDQQPLPEAPAKHWYVVHARAGYEKRVMQALKERIALSDYAEKFGEVLVPTEDVVELKGGKKRQSERKFYPGYVLVEMQLDDDTWHLVKETPRVLGFIGGKPESPAHITEAEASAIMQRMQRGLEKPLQKTVYEPGELVRVIDGPFNDFSGEVEQVNYEKNRLRVGVIIFGRKTPVELDFSQVQKG